MNTLQPSAGDVLVRKLGLHAPLTAADVEALRRLPFTHDEVPANGGIMRERDRPNRCCLVVDGVLFRSRLTEDGKRQILSFHVAGDLPDLQTLYLQVNDHDLSAAGHASVAFIPHEALRALAASHPLIAVALWRETLVDAAIFRDWIVNIGRRAAEARLGHLFCELAWRLKRAGRMPGNDIRLPLTQVHLADALGLSSVHVNRTLQTLRHEGVFELQDRTLRFTDLEKLQRASGFDPLYLHGEPFPDRSLQNSATS